MAHLNANIERPFMGLFSFFKEKTTESGFLKAPIDKVAGAAHTPGGSAGPKPNAFSPQPEVPFGRRILAVKPGPNLFVAYDEVFFKEMATIAAFSKGDVEAMHRLITQGDGGSLNQGRCHQAVFDQFFVGREWTWPWFEKWDSTFTKLGEYPSNWANYRPLPKEVEPSDVVKRLNVGELKELLTCAGINYPAQATKVSLIKAALASPEAIRAITRLLLWPIMREKVFHLEGLGLYNLLTRTIIYRAISVVDQERKIKLRMAKGKLLSAFPSDQKFVVMALAENPDALGPLYPGDASFWTVENSGFEGR